MYIRPIRSADADRLTALYDRLSGKTVYQRFFTLLRRLPPDWAQFLATVDYVRRLALVAVDERDPDGDVIAVARYESEEGDSAPEVAFVVQDEWQTRGLGTLMFCKLLAEGRARGIEEFRAYVLAENSRMLHLITCLTDVRDRKLDRGVVELRFSFPKRDAKPGG